ncbi:MULTISPECIES: DUF3347 domain-containing protein [Chryseobacterium]|jgi:hypothetical protein|uniref:DUF3347 domain-containing protein n=1 Tax=Chryseobacterium aquaticum TaxID=452084 RepID=A0A0Q3PAS8_9FLAO|nr:MULTISPECIES: DUF3347 domain-containing protein [Chryseobacterium]KQK26734.1 hypothetical protein AR438_05730 [Chryseobacterium aquaticum]KQM36490.1 hypothetical protein ASE55_04065 [Chryseobacterium sp. Leaf201]KQS94226.1 hypothetical protein ASG21_18460 [Chryseobacterium sp. Leaf394]KQT20276.1 hypothetical protein ASG31_17765 [Chryseobacterium sp. Leaf404]WFB65477.1 DUF3347 domain-containing protein [Chryseobacterium sp. WX]
MKNIIFSIITLVTIATVTISCNQSSNKNSDQQANDSTTIAATPELQSPIHNDTVATVTSTDTSSQEAEKSDVKQTQKFTIAPIIKDYLALKNALVADNDKTAANAGKQLFTTLKNVDMNAIPANKHKEYMEIAEDAKENAEHIGDNAGKVDHQREHFASLSKDVSDLITLFGTTQKLYQDFCPMYNDGKGAIWISEAKAIKNPYYGSQMLTCGSVKKDL